MQDYTGPQWNVDMDGTKKMFAKAIKTTLSEFKNDATKKKWLIIFSTSIP